MLEILANFNQLNIIKKQIEKNFLSTINRKLLQITMEGGILSLKEKGSPRDGEPF